MKNSNARWDNTRCEQRVPALKIVKILKIVPAICLAPEIEDQIFNSSRSNNHLALGSRNKNNFTYSHARFQNNRAYI